MLKYVCGLCYGIYVMKIFNKKTAFTLAELLLTISIIGVLAALTIPTLNIRVKDRENLTRFKAMYTRLVSALETVSIDKVYPCYITPPEGSAARTKYFNNLGDDVPEVKPDAIGANHACRSSKEENATGLMIEMVRAMGDGRFIDMSSGGSGGYSDNISNYRSHLNELTDENIKYIYILKDSTVIFQKNYNRPVFYIDTNGLKGPNMLGKDIFHMAFYLEDAKTKTTGSGYSQYTRISPRKIGIYLFDLDAADTDPQMALFKHAIGAK